MAMSSRKRRHSRRGAALVGWIMAAALMLIAVGALVIDAARIAARHQQLSVACQSSALAGAGQLMDRSILYPAIVNEENEERIRLMRYGQCWEAQEQAKLCGKRNFVGGKPVLLALNESNRADGEMVIGWTGNPTALRSEMRPWNGDGPINTLEVRKSLSKRGGNPMSLRLASLIGKSEVDVTAVARACVDQRVFGFRPVNGMSVPLMPFVVRPISSGMGWLEQAWAPISDTNDQFAFNESTRSFEPGRDGIPEIQLVFQIGTHNRIDANARLLSLPANRETGLVATIRRQLRVGLASHDLRHLGQRFALDQRGELLLAQAPEISPELLSVLIDELAELALSGKGRIWPLGEEGQQAGQTMQVVRGFAAGRIVALEQNDDRLIVRVQSCLMTTAAALVENGRPQNPWIGKIIRTL